MSEIHNDSNTIQKKDKVDTTKEVTKTSEKEVEEITQEDQDKNTDDHTEQILALVSQSLNMSIEEVEQLLSNLNLSVEDLLGSEGFSQFITNVLGNGDMNALLTNQVDLKAINELFNQLQTIGGQQEEVVANEHSVLNIVAEMQTSSNMVQGTGETVEATHIATDSHAEGMLETTVQTVANGEVNPKYAKQNENVEVSHLDLAMQTEGAEDIGITVPIHNFTTTTFTKTHYTSDGMMSQMTVTKQVKGGEFVLDQVDFKVLGQTKELSVQLSPKELGTMNIKIVENNGAMVAEIKVESEKTKAFIMNEIEGLKENLEQQGLNVSDVKVDVRQDDARSQMEQERQKSSKRIQEIIDAQFAEEVEEISETVIDSESEVDYMV